MLLVFDNWEHFLVEVDRKELLAPLSSQLASGWMIAGQAQPGWTCDHWKQSTSSLWILSVLKHWGWTHWPNVLAAEAVRNASFEPTTLASRRTRNMR
jgi:hypothetical protein